MAHLANHAASVSDLSYTGVKETLKTDSKLHLGVRLIGYPRKSSEMVGYGGISSEIFGDLGYLFDSLVDISWKRYPSRISEDILKYPIDLQIRSPYRISYKVPPYLSMYLHDHPTTISMRYGNQHFFSENRKFSENFSEFLKIFQKFWKYFRNSENISGILKIIQEFWKYFRNSENISGILKNSENPGK